MTDRDRDVRERCAERLDEEAKWYADRIDNYTNKGTRAKFLADQIAYQTAAKIIRALDLPLTSADDGPQLVHLAALAEHIASLDSGSKDAAAIRWAVARLRTLTSAREVTDEIVARAFHAVVDLRLGNKTAGTNREKFVAEFGYQIDRDVRAALKPLSPPLLSLLAWGEERVKCKACGADTSGHYYMCDRAEGQWCPPCFSETPCGKDKYGEGCPTGVFTAAPDIEQAGQPFPKGWQLVPAAPTDGMIHFAQEAMKSQWYDTATDYAQDAAELYRVMLANAPVHETYSSAPPPHHHRRRTGGRTLCRCGCKTVRASRSISRRGLVPRKWICTNTRCTIYSSTLRPTPLVKAGKRRSNTPRPTSPHAGRGRWLRRIISLTVSAKAG